MAASGPIRYSVGAGTAASLLALVSFVGCSKSSKPVFDFETKPRAVLAKAAPEGSKHPRIAARPSGAIYMLAVYGSRLGLFASHDGGDSFGPAVPVSEPGGEIVSHGENSPSLAFGDTEIYALWEQRRKDGGTDLLFARSVDFGATFQKPVRVPDKTDKSPNIFSHLPVSPTRAVYAAWLDGRQAGRGTFSVYLARSDDRGATFGPNVEVAKLACPCCRPTLAFGPQGEVHVAWRKVFEGDIRDIVVSTSRDGGMRFGEPVRVAVDNWKIAGCPHSGPVIASAGRRLYAAWFSQGSKNDAGVRLGWSDDAGATFRPPIIVSQGVLDANHPALAVTDDGRAMIAFEGRPASPGEHWKLLQVFFLEIGRSAAAPTPIPVRGLAASVSYPSLAVDGARRIFLAWTESAAENDTVCFARGRPAR